MKLGQISINWFDFLVVVLLLVGALRGRKRGMSEELLDVFQWLAIVVVAGFFYATLGRCLVRFAHAGPVLANVLGYLTILGLLKLSFTFCKRLVGEKLVDSDVFGRFEYYLGMVAGTVRFACMILVGLALLNAKHISAAELAEQAQMQKDNFGDISFPTLGSVQQDVFQGSLTGALVKNHLGAQLVAAAPSQSRDSRVGIGKKRQRAVEEIIKATN